MTKKKFILSVMIVCFATICGLGLNANAKTASALTQKQAKAKIKVLKKDIKSLKKKKKKELAKEKKQAKGAKYIIGNVVCRNPYIISVKPLIGYSNSYYWITNSKYMSDALILTGGYVKLTGKYRRYNGYTCAVGKAIKVSQKSIAYQKKIDKKEKSLETYQGALKEKVVFNSNVNEINLGKQQYLGRHWKYSGKYNKIKWKSSNSGIVSVDGNGTVTAKKLGTVTISATCTLSKITTKCIVKVMINDNNNNDNANTGDNGDAADNDNVDNIQHDGDYYINLVKSCKDLEYVYWEEGNLEEYFIVFFKNPQWVYYKSDAGEDIVEFRGSYYDFRKEEDVPVCMQFMADSDRDIKVVYLEFDGRAQDSDTIDSFLNGVLLGWWTELE